jgi:undecaprenyl-phosphate 4-deoxy-4-formamido-L-arabinose transferase
MSASPPLVSVVVPCYRSEQSLEELVRRLCAALEPVTTAFEVVLVDDDSPDASWATIEALAAGDDRVRGVRLSRNYGQHNALLAGIRGAAYDVIVTIDDDLQHRPEEIPTLLNALTDDVDLVYGYPADENHSFARNVLSRATKVALGASIKSDVAKHVSAFRVFRTVLRDGFADTHDPFLSLDVALSWTTTRAVALPVPMDDRRYGASNYSARRLVVIALNLITGFSTFPLRLVSYAGFSFSLFGLVVLAYVVVSYIVHGGQSSPGFPFLASLIAILGGTQLFALGVIGEYIGRMHYRSMSRPAYNVRERSGTDERP